MPYIVTTKRVSATRTTPPNDNDLLSRRAVATLEGARTSAEESVKAHAVGLIGQWRRQAESLPESGGTIGPLPDGTVIEVERVTWHDIAREGGLSYADAMSFAVDAERGSEAAQRILLDAYNARQS
jgi:hypothetical protein